MTKYTTYLNLQFDPFDSALEAIEFFAGSNREFLLDKLIEQSRYNSDILVVVGPLGMGKTTLAEQFNQSLDESLIGVRVQATLFMDKVQLLEAICGSLSLAHEPQCSADELSRVIANFAANQANRSKTLQLIVDDAHELGDDALQALLDLVESQADATGLGEDGIKAALFGEAHLLNMLDQLLPEEAGAVFELAPLDEEDVIDYVRTKLAGAGYAGEFPIEAAAMQTICRNSNGIPGAVNALMHDELNQRDGVSYIAPSLKFPEKHLIAASFLFAALLVTLFFFAGDDEGDLVANQLAGAEEAQQGRIEIPLDINGATQPETREPATEDIRQLTARAMDSQTSATEAVIADSTQIAEAATSSTVVNQEGVERIEARVVAETPAPEVVAVAETVQPANNQVVRTPVVADIPEEASEGFDSPAPAKVSHKLLAFSSQAYALQLLGSRSEENAKKFITENGGGDDYAYFETRFQEKPWFVVVYGNYPDSSAAKSAISVLPAPLRELNPWARQLAEIQADIRKYQK